MRLGIHQIEASGTRSSTTFLRGDSTWAAPPGGGGSSSAWPPGSADKPPAVSNAKDDEFDGLSSVSWVNGPFAPSTWSINSTRESHAIIGSNGNGNNLVTKVQTVPAFPFTAMAKLAGSTARLANNTVGIILAPASPASTSPVLIAGLQTAAANEFYQRLLWSNHTSSFTSSVVARNVGTASGNPLKAPMPLYLRFDVASATSVAVGFSWDGWNWVYTDSALNPGFTPGVMGIGIDEFGTANLAAHFDWFRVT